MEPLTADSGVLKSTLHEGDGMRVPPKSLCTVHYEAWLAGEDDDGSWPAKEAAFDSSRQRGFPFSFTLGCGVVIPGWEVAIRTMRVGDVVQLRIAPSYGFGAVGNPPRVPPSAVLLYELQLLDVTPPAEEPSLGSHRSGALSRELRERLQRAQADKQRGNDCFKRRMYKKATRIYKRALQRVRGLRVSRLGKEEGASVMDFKVTCYLNIAASHLKLRNYRTTVSCCNRALRLQPDNLKALFRRGQALSAQEQFKRARADLLRAATLAPKNSDIRAELARLKKRIAQHKMKERRMFAGIFDSGGSGGGGSGGGGSGGGGSGGGGSGGGGGSAALAAGGRGEGSRVEAAAAAGVVAGLSAAV